MALTLVAGQSATVQNSGSRQYDLAFPGDVTSGNLAICILATFRTVDEPFVAGELTKQAGTATVGSATLDAQSIWTDGGGQYWGSTIMSIPITGPGSLTLRVAAPLAGDFGWLMIREYTGADVTATRVEDSATATGNSTSPSSGDVDGSSGNLFVGAYAGAGAGAITPDAAWAQIFEYEAGTPYSNFETRDGPATDAATWTCGSGGWGASCAVFKTTVGGVRKWFFGRIA